MHDKRIAVIGGGVAGLSAAWLLRQHYDVTLFDKNDYIGGHSHTIEVDTGSGKVGVDTGFVVYNRKNYPNLVKLFDWLDVETQPTHMSFAVSADDGNLEYAGSGISALFAQRRNLLSRQHWRMLNDILRFNRAAKQDLRRGLLGTISLGNYLSDGDYSTVFQQHYLLPMTAAIWSCPTNAMLGFPAASLLKFLDNHALLDLSNRPVWRTVVGGSHHYVAKMLNDLRGTYHYNSPIVMVNRNPNNVAVYVKNQSPQYFDEVVFACHADETLKILANPSAAEKQLLGSFQYQENRTLLHRDDRLMPERKRVWSSWNYMTETRADLDTSVSVTYWMNHLQNLSCKEQFFVSLNPLREPRTESVVAEMTYHHPVFNKSAMSAQNQLDTIQGIDRIWFCGSYCGYGFHEDALSSSIKVANKLGVYEPWLINSPQENNPISTHDIAEVTST